MQDTRKEEKEKNKKQNKTKQNQALTRITFKRIQNYNITISKTSVEWGKRGESITVNTASKLVNHKTGHLYVST